MEGRKYPIYCQINHPEFQLLRDVDPVLPRVETQETHDIALYLSTILHNVAKTNYADGNLRADLMDGFEIERQGILDKFKLYKHSYVMSYGFANGQLK